MIQDDNNNPNAAVSKPAADSNSSNQVNPVEPPATPVAPSMPEPTSTAPEPIQAPASTPAPVAPTVPPAQVPSGTPSSSEIDQLLADLDKLSKDLDKDVAKDQPAPQAAASTPAPSEKPISPDAVPEPPAEKPEEKPVEPVAKSPKSEENFDFDAFLADLEKKIDEESSKREGTAAADSEEANFRQNRAKPALEEEEKQESVGSKKLDPRTMELADITDMMDFPDKEEFKKEKASAPSKTTPDTKQMDTDESNPEDLKSQNIFEMLGLASISEEEKDKFLDELEEMIWTDFTMHDIKLLLTSGEYTGAKQILDKTGDENQKKEELITYLEKLIPDLDEVLYEKALELKSEMMGERLKQLRAAGSHLEEIKEAEDLISQNRWKSAVSLLNQLS